MESIGKNKLLSKMVYILVMERFSSGVWKSDESLVCYRYTHEPLGECVCQENDKKVTKRDIPCY